MSLPHSVNMAGVPPRPLVPDRALGPLQLSVCNSARDHHNGPKTEARSGNGASCERSGVPRQTPTFSKKFQAAHVNKKRKETGRGKKVMKSSATWIVVAGGVTLHKRAQTTGFGERKVSNCNTHCNRLKHPCLQVSTKKFLSHPACATADNNCKVQLHLFCLVIPR